MTKIDYLPRTSLCIWRDEELGAWYQTTLEFSDFARMDAWDVSERLLLAFTLPGLSAREELEIVGGQIMHYVIEEWSRLELYNPDTPLAAYCARAVAQGGAYARS